MYHKLLALILLMPILRRWLFFAPAPGGGVDLQDDEWGNYG